MRAIVLHNNHESSTAGHRGVQKTISLIGRTFYWPSMKSDMQSYVDSCHKCQEAKSCTQVQGGLLIPFPPPTRKWEVISMDFIFKLPKKPDKKTAILVVVDNLSKRTHFIALEANHNAKNTAQVFYENIYKHHGLQ